MYILSVQDSVKTFFCKHQTSDLTFEALQTFRIILCLFVSFIHF